MSFKNLDAEIMTGATVRVAPGSSETFTMLIDAKIHHELSAPALAGVTIEAKFNISDAWQNITTSPLDLSAFSPNAKQVYFRVSVAGGHADGQILESLFVEPF